MSRLEALRGDFAVVQRMLRGMPRAASHAESLSAFYAPQAQHYDRFRERLLRGRAELIERLPLADGARVVELGGGTGRNAEFFGAKLERIDSLTIVDVCAPLLAQAHERARRIPRIRVVEADATTYAARRAGRRRLLLVCADDDAGLARGDRECDRDAEAGRCARCRGFLRFREPTRRVGLHAARRADARLLAGVVRVTTACCVSSEHFPALRRALPDHAFVEQRANVPYLPFGRVPYLRIRGPQAGLRVDAATRGLVGLTPARRIELGDLVVGQLQSRRSGDVAHLLRVRRACDRRGDARARNQPRERNLCWGRTMDRCDRVERGQHAQSACVEIFLRPSRRARRSWPDQPRCGTCRSETRWRARSSRRRRASRAARPARCSSRIPCAQRGCIRAARLRSAAIHAPR